MKSSICLLFAFFLFVPVISYTQAPAQYDSGWGSGSYGNYYGGGWGRAGVPGVVTGAPIGGYYGPAYPSCGLLRECNAKSCTLHQVCY